jgi:hypothetical protein
MGLARRSLRTLFYSLVFIFLIYRAVSSGISHDENQFVAAGQFVGEHGLLPYRDFPYTHMPYGLIFYGLAALISPYDYLAGRLLGAVAWMACIALMIMICRLIGTRLSDSEDSFAALLGEFALVFVFLFHPIASYVLGAALNHSYATLFSLLALYLMVRGLLGVSSLEAAALGSGACIAAAAFVRLNYAALVVVLLGLWLLFVWSRPSPRPGRLLLRFSGGVALASLPGLALAALAPAAFYYGNIVYIRLNTLYYAGILFHQNMDFASKAASFFNGLIHDPLDIALYAFALLVGIGCIVRFARKRSAIALAGLSAAAFAFTLLLTAFSPTPTQAHYFFAPLPFILILVWVLASALAPRFRPSHLLVFGVLVLLLLLAGGVPNQFRHLPDLWHPSDWTPVQVHSFAEDLKRYVPGGRVLCIVSLIPLDAGYDSYGFTATGPFSWRTSLLLTPGRRLQYGVISPEELPHMLDASPPAGILTGLETPNAGFTQGDLGGLEIPFIEYARQHDYTPITLSPSFLEHNLTFWVRQP